MTDKKVIGFFAYIEKEYPVCSGDGCVVAGSEDVILNYASEVLSEDKSLLRTRKVRFGDLLNGLQRGAAYAFDKESYNRFFPLAKQMEIPVPETNFEDVEKEGNKFLIIRLDVPS